jgi:hypothetical protein
MLLRVDPRLADYEARFRRAGLPLFVAGTTARTEVWTRAVPVLGLVFIGEVLGAIDLQWSTLANVGALLGGFAILLGGLALANRARGRSLLARPRDVGAIELAGFVLLPAVLPAIFGGQTRSAWVTAVSNLAVLAVLYGTIRYGVLSIVAWAARRLGGQLATSVVLLARAIPLLMLFSVVLFLTTEMWQTFARMDDASLGAIAGLLVAVGTLFLVARLPREVESLERDVGGGPPLSRQQRFNVGLVMFVSHALQVLVVSLAVGVFFVAFGLLAIPASLLDTWVGSPPETFVTIAGVDVHTELLRVSAAIAAFSGLYYAIAVLTDATYREEFLSELEGSMRETFAARAEYLALRTVGTVP